MDFIYLIMMRDSETGSSVPMVAYESEEAANEDCSDRTNDELHSFHVESLAFYKK